LISLYFVLFRLYTEKERFDRRKNHCRTNKQARHSIDPVRGRHPHPFLTAVRITRYESTRWARLSAAVAFARAAIRGRELAARLAIGASRRRVAPARDSRRPHQSACRHPH
jgi:hypothetical protein